MRFSLQSTIDRLIMQKGVFHTECHALHCCQRNILQHGSGRVNSVHVPAVLLTAMPEPKHPICHSAPLLCHHAGRLCAYATNFPHRERIPRHGRSPGTSSSRHLIHLATAPFTLRYMEIEIVEVVEIVVRHRSAGLHVKSTAFVLHFILIKISYERTTNSSAQVLPSRYPRPAAAA